jgi:hypothetical protein
LRPALRHRGKEKEKNCDSGNGGSGKDGKRIGSKFQHRGTSIERMSLRSRFDRLFLLW